MRLLVLLLALTVASPAVGQNFSCSFGKQPACLDYGAQVCSSSGKCVDSNAACFDSYQCGYEGFTCKSNVTECIDAQEKLLRKHNTLVDDYNGLLKKHKELVADFDETITAARALKSDYDRIESSLADMETCLIYASTLDTAKRCTP
ncbi:hypothetical protein ACEN2J_17565 [Pseudorhodobacter sp. W20_MBD10_FR17]|uniref:hypothetical protein n=1 Tax=Pseudorhodobacter sp. W20_MBD10_FR17 TaxID=3240266 RepID=UPI003F986375